MNRTVDIPARNEWRFELKKDAKLKVKLVSGTAEIQGTELSPTTTYEFKGSLKNYIYSYTGAQLEIEGEDDNGFVEYISDDSLVYQYFNLALGLKQMIYDGHPARVLVVGAKSSGKTILATTLTSYLLKLVGGGIGGDSTGNFPVLVNLDPELPNFVVPGNLTVTPISSLFNLENVNLGESVINGVSSNRQKQPGVLSYGMIDFKSNLKLFRFVVDRLSVLLNDRMSKDKTVGKGGVIIDSPVLGLDDLELVEHIVKKFSVNTVVVLGNERLTVNLKKKLNNVNILKLNKSSGCVDKDDKYVRELQQRMIKEYFYGLDNVQLNPFTISVNYNDLIILKPKEQNINLNFLSGDFDDNDNIKSEDTQTIDPNSLYERIKGTKENLSNAILTILDDSSIDTNRYINDPENYELNKELITKVSTKAVLGSSYVLSTDDTKSKLLIPIPVTQLPSKVVILTEFRYHE